MSKRKKAIVPSREPNGRLSRITESEINARSPAAVKRLRDMALRKMADQIWGTELGRLFLDGKITEGQFEAGRRWGALVHRYHAAIGTSPDPKALSYGESNRNAPPDPDSPKGKKIAAADRAVIRDMQEAHAALIGVGMLAERQVRATCERDEVVCDEIARRFLCHGLESLATAWGLTKQSSQDYTSDHRNRNSARS